MVNIKRRMGKKTYGLGALLVVALLLGSTAMFALTTADAASSLDHTIGKDSRGRTVVKNDYGRTIFSSPDATRAIQYAIDRTPNGGSVIMGEGKYALRGGVRVGGGITLAGTGNMTSLSNGQILVQASDVVIRDLRMEGNCHLMIMPGRAPISNVLVQDVSATVGKVESAFSVLTNSYTVSDVRFIRDSVTDSASSGFLLSGSAPISDVLIKSCKVLRSGLDARFNDWVTGFIIAQNAPINNVLVVNCEASSNWESGFFLKPEVEKRDVTLKDCIANDNGRKTGFVEGYGFYLDESVAVIDCDGMGNQGGLSNLASFSVPDPEPVPAPEPSRIVLTLGGPNLEAGKAVTVTGALMGAGGIPGARVMVNILLPDGDVITPVRGGAVITDSEGRFVVSYTPIAAGTYTFTATFAGDEHSSASSASRSFKVTVPAPEEPVPDASRIILALNDASVEVGKAMTATGTLSASGGIAGALITVKVICPDGRVVDLAQGATVITDDSGRFLVSHIPTQVGKYRIIVTFSGNGHYSASSASASFDVVAPPVPEPDPEPILPKYDLKISVAGRTYRVVDGEGVQKYSGSDAGAAIQWAINVLPSRGGTVYLAAGTYVMSNMVYIRSNTNLLGDGPDKTILIKTTRGEGGICILDGSNVVVKQLGFSGHAHLVYVLSPGASRSNVLFEDVTMRDVASDVAGAFWFWLNDGSTLSDVTIRRCKVIDSGVIGFLLEGEVPSSSMPWFKNVLFEDCLASGCGRDTRFNNWVCGFDFTEAANIQDLTVRRCVAEYCWEAGFHFENRPKHLNVVFEDCVTRYNGLKPSNHNNGDGTIGVLYGAGWMLGLAKDSHNIQLINCYDVGSRLGMTKVY